MSLNKKILNFINELRNEGEDVFPFLYNKKLEQFNAEKDWIYYSGPFWGDEEVAAAMESLISGKWIAAGEKVGMFERAFSKKYNFTSSLMVNSGSSANLVMIAASKKFFNWHDGDEVIVSPVGFPTTISPLLQNNLVPRFIDITFSDLNFDLDLVEKAISSKTKAVFLSPVLGNSPDMDRLLDICNKNDIKLILDGCDSLGSKWKGKELSEYAEVTSCSFYPAHHLTTGEGGMVSSNHKELVSLARKFAWWGRDCYCTGSTNLSAVGACGKRFDHWIEGYEHKVDHKYLFSEIGYNLKPLELQGAIGLVQIEKSEVIHEQRRNIKNKISTLFEAKFGDRIRIPSELPDSETSWFGVPIICNENKLKQALVEHLENNRIQTRNYFAGNILLHPGYKHLQDAKNFPLSNRVLDEVFFVGCHPSFNESVFSRIEEVLNTFSY